MPKYQITYFGGDSPSSPEQGQAHFAKYQQWLADMGESVISPMNPLKNSVTIDPSGASHSGSKSAMSGHTIIVADSIEHALEMCRGCPFLDINGYLEVAEVVEMN